MGLEAWTARAICMTVQRDFHTFAQSIPTGFPLSSTELICSVSNVLQKAVEAAEHASIVSHMRYAPNVPLDFAGAVETGVSHSFKGRKPAYCRQNRNGP